jgi:AraC family transcriptional regulator
MGLKLKAGQFYGETAQALTANGFRFTEKSYSNRTKLPSHAHELSHFCLVLAGGYREKIGAVAFEREPRALVYYPPDVTHAEEHHTEGRHFLVEIDFKGLERVQEYGARLNEPVAFAGDATSWLAARMYREFRERDKFSALALECISNELLIAASRRNSQVTERQPPQWIARVKEFLHESFNVPPSLTKLAGSVEIHPTHLTRVFRQFERCTVGDYIRKIRIEQACQKILFSNESLVEIALETGFADQTHFTRSFKRITGMTPGKYRHIFKSR